MSNLPPNAAIFSPSVARAAASTAKDWNYVDGWLSARFRGRAPPPFERNPDTLRALLALAALNESADEERDLLSRVEASALAEAERGAAAEGRKDGDDGGGYSHSHSYEAVRDDILAALEANLTREGRTALDAMAATAVELGLALPTPEALSRRLVDLGAQAAEYEAAAGRAAALGRHVGSRRAAVEALSREVAADAYQASPDLARLNLEAQRRIRHLEGKAPEPATAAAGSAEAVPDLTVEDVRKEEEAFLALLEEKRTLDAQVRAFQGLPPDAELARRELETRRAELMKLTRQRDAVFEGLVERETPRKTKR